MFFHQYQYPSQLHLPELLQAYLKQHKSPEPETGKEKLLFATDFGIWEYKQGQDPINLSPDKYLLRAKKGTHSIVSLDLSIIH